RISVEGPPLGGPSAHTDQARTAQTPGPGASRLMSSRSRLMEPFWNRPHGMNGNAGEPDFRDLAPRRQIGISRNQRSPPRRLAMQKVVGSSPIIRSEKTLLGGV